MQEQKCQLRITGDRNRGCDKPCEQRQGMNVRATLPPVRLLRQQPQVEVVLRKEHGWRKHAHHAIPGWWRQQVIVFHQKDQGEPTQKLKGAAYVENRFENHWPDSWRKCPRWTIRGAELYVYPRCLR